jgi:FkbM family methyltransferase
MSRIFMDVGAHYGETAVSVLDARYQFDRVCCFEPSKECVPTLTQLGRSDERLELYFFGLSGKTRNAKLYDSGSLSASILGALGDNPGIQRDCETVLLVDIFDWINRETKPNDFIVLKLNCEGGEVEILDRLLEANIIDRFYSVLITFDIREFPGGTSEERRLRRLLRASDRPNFCFSDDVMIGPSHDARLRNWLDTFGVSRSGLTTEELRTQFHGVFRRYANKSGRFARLESTFKRLFRFKKLPSSVKNFFRFIKRLLRLNRERVR